MNALTDEQWWDEVCKESEELRQKDPLWKELSSSDVPSEARAAFIAKAGLLKLRRELKEEILVTAQAGPFALMKGLFDGPPSDKT